MYQLDFFSYKGQKSRVPFDKREPVDLYLRELLATYREDEGLKQQPCHPALLRGDAIQFPVVQGGCHLCQPPSPEQPSPGFPRESWDHLELGPMPNFEPRMVAECVWCPGWPGLRFMAQTWFPKGKRVSSNLKAPCTGAQAVRGVHLGPWRLFGDSQPD